jgi:hypothetical protein
LNKISPTRGLVEDDCMGMPLRLHMVKMSRAEKGEFLGLTPVFELFGLFGGPVVGEAFHGAINFYWHAIQPGYDVIVEIRDIAGRALAESLRGVASRR